MIPISRPALGREDLRAVIDAIEGGVPSVGDDVEAFEREFAAYVGRRCAVAVSSGTSALQLALAAAGVGPLDTVAVPASTYIATANAVRHLGAHVRLYDNPDLGEGLLTRGGNGDVPAPVSAILAVDLYGEVVYLPDALRRQARVLGVPIIEDACQALGATGAGQQGDLAVFSFFGNKVLTTGEGGMIVTDDPVQALMIKALRNHGVAPGDDRYAHRRLGTNARMANLNAALGRAQLRALPARLDRRRAICFRYRDALKTCPTFDDAWLPGHAPWLYTFATPRARFVRTVLAAAGIDSRAGFPSLGTLAPHVSIASFPFAEDLAERAVSLPTYPDLTDEEQRRIIQVVQGAL